MASHEGTIWTKDVGDQSLRIVRSYRPGGAYIAYVQNKRISSHRTLLEAGRRAEEEAARLGRGDNPGAQATPRRETSMTTKRKSKSTIEREFVDAAARALFVQAWGDREEELRRSHSGQDLMDVAPPTPSAAKKAAKELSASIEKLNGKSIGGLYENAESAEGRHRREPTIEDFGHYLAMQALGHGVSWFDDHPDFPLVLPSGEFHMQGPRDFHWEWSERLARSAT